MKAITVLEHFHGNQLVECFKKNKFCVRMSNDTYQVLLKFLQVREAASYAHVGHIAYV